MHTTVTIPNADTGARVVVHALADTDGGYVREAAVELADSGLHARGVVDIQHPDGGRDTDLAEFFQELAGSWRGWAGARTWRSLCGCLRLEATHDGVGRVSLAATLAPLYEAWSARVVVQVEAGEQISQLAADLREQSRDGQGSG